MTTPATLNEPQGHYPKCPSKGPLPRDHGVRHPRIRLSPSASARRERLAWTYTTPRSLLVAGQSSGSGSWRLTTPFLIEVNWCVCGAFAASLCGCWEINFFLDDVDGVGTTSGRLPNSTRTVAVDSRAGGPRHQRRCHETVL